MIRSVPGWWNFGTWPVNALCVNLFVSGVALPLLFCLPLPIPCLISFPFLMILRRKGARFGIGFEERKKNEVNKI
jgi:hypothetical protein